MYVCVCVYENLCVSACLCAASRHVQVSRCGYLRSFLRHKHKHKRTHTRTYTHTHTQYTHTHTHRAKNSWWASRRCFVSGQQNESFGGEFNFGRTNTELYGNTMFLCVCVCVCGVYVCV